MADYDETTPCGDTADAAADRAAPTPDTDRRMKEEQSPVARPLGITVTQMITASPAPVPGEADGKETVQRGRRRPMPVGLPAMFLDRVDGRTKLTRFLGIANRKQQEGIIRQVRAHVPDIWSGDLKDLPTADRHREVLLRFYSMPEQRLALWKAEIDMGEESEGRIPPSLEYEALLAYDPDLPQRPLEETRAEAAVADFPGIVDSIFGPPHWQDLALAVLPDLRDNVRNWNTLTPDRRETVPLALFAAATVLEDGRLLQWAGRAVEAIGDEFAPLLDAMEAEDDAAGVAGMAGVAFASHDEIDENGRETALAPWADACHAVADTAVILAEDPRQPRRLKALHDLVQALDEVRDPAATTLEAHDLLAGVRDTLAAVLDETGAEWLRPALAQIDAQWRLACLTQEHIDPKGFRRDLERLRKVLRAAAAAWRKAEDRKLALREELLELYQRPANRDGAGVADDAPESDDTDAQRDLQAHVDADARAADLLEAMVEATREAHAASTHCLSVVGPTGEPFDATRDYVAEWNALRVRPAAGLAGGPEADTVSAAAEAAALARAKKAEQELAAALKAAETAKVHEEQALTHAAELEDELVQLRNQVTDLKAKLAQLTEASDASVPTFDPLPSSWSEFGVWVEDRLAGRLTLAPLARRGVKNSEFRDVEEAARCLVWLATDYRDRRLNGGGNLHAPVLGGLHNEPCGEADLPFSPMKWHGRNVDIEWHIKNGGNTRDRARCLRIYYFWDADTQEVVVASMPAHARTNLT